MLALAVANIMYSFVVMIWLHCGRMAAADEIMFFGLPMVTGAMASIFLEE